MHDVWVIDACRTPRGIGRAGKGALCGIHPQQLGASVLAALAERNALDTGAIDDIVMGCNYQRGFQANDLARMAALDAGYAVTASGVTLDRFCGSGITAVTTAAASIMAGMDQLSIGGGVEMMSLYDQFDPFVDSGNERLRARHPQPHQGLCADAIATLEQIGRETLDALACESQRRAATAINEGRFNRSLIPVHRADGSLALAADEYPRPSTTIETLSTLKPAFASLADKPLNEQGTSYRQLLLKRYPNLQVQHVHHAGNSSGVVDGAAAVLLASEDYARAQGLKPRARIRAWANVGDCPTLMLNAPAPAARKVLARAGLSLADIDLFEINEAFAVVAEKFMRDLDLDRERVNVNGGSIALGHPIGATGAILIGTALDELERSDKQFALITMCAAGGMAPAVIIERI